jgi:hypothetical protein
VFTSTSEQSILGRYDATQPRGQYERTPVTISLSPTAASGSGSFYIARAGHVQVESLGNGGVGGMFGTVKASLRLQGGNDSVHLRGTWVC